MQLKICFLAPSGYGKSTAIKIMKKYWSIYNLKIGKPLYELQNDFYSKINKPLTQEQDGELLQFYGLKIRKENPSYLLDYFEYNLYQIKDDFDFITNDDCRPYDYARLKELGFIFVKINSFKHVRDDHSPINDKLKIEWQDEIPFDYLINNVGDLNEYEKNIINMVKEVTNDYQVLYNSKSKKL